MNLIEQPTDILVEIFKYVPSRELIRLHRVSKGISYIIKQIIPRLVIDLSNTNITDAGLVHLKGVHTIDLSETNITDIGLMHLKGVHKINLSGTNITDAGLV